MTGLFTELILPANDRGRADQRSTSCLTIRFVVSLNIIAKGSISISNNWKLKGPLSCTLGQREIIRYCLVCCNGGLEVQYQEFWSKSRKWHQNRTSVMQKTYLILSNVFCTSKVYAPAPWSEFYNRYIISWPGGWTHTWADLYFSLIIKI